MSVLRLLPLQSLPETETQKSAKRGGESAGRLPKEHRRASGASRAAHTGLGVVGTPEFLARVEKIVYGLIAAGAVFGVFYFSQKYGSAIKQTFRKR